MQEFKRYAHAPIVEAILDIRVVLNGDVALEALAEVGTAVKATYPTRRNRMQFEGSWAAGSEVSIAGHQSQLGYIFFSTDERQSFQARLDGFTFSRFDPYTSWD